MVELDGVAVTRVRLQVLGSADTVVMLRVTGSGLSCGLEWGQKDNVGCVGIDVVHQLVHLCERLVTVLVGKVAPKRHRHVVVSHKRLPLLGHGNELLALRDKVEAVGRELGVCVDLEEATVERRLVRKDIVLCFENVERLTIRSPSYPHSPGVQ